MAVGAFFKTGALAKCFTCSICNYRRLRGELQKCKVNMKKRCKLKSFVKWSFQNLSTERLESSKNQKLNLPSPMYPRLQAQM